ncbi:hypothetical protein J1605_002254 [Eschrichtius robustus]|uniref:Uncharacterized protein n=1 Tax=Eschrichtius robustus TaxID=9764 RepID=A0AB34HYR0_ESCRO|nr:hypothetical protein J1605_002254 [Eschrichtius robustus]
MKHRPLPKAVVVADGSLAPAGTDPDHFPLGSEILVASSSDTQARGAFPEQGPPSPQAPPPPTCLPVS